jgi:uncharacterized protein YktA (UPF0223 family)
MKENDTEPKYQSIISIDNYNRRYYQFRDGSVESIQEPHFKKQNYYSAFIANKDLIIAPVTVSRNIPEEDLPGALEDKAYDELGLDPATEYFIQYREYFGEGDGRHFQLFILEENKYSEIFGNLRDEIKYLDLLLPAPLLYQCLYDGNLVERKKVHCYLYFTYYDTTLTFYRDGEYLYSKSINYSMRQLYDRYCEIVGKTVDEKQFFRIFQKEGVKTTHLEFQQNLIKLFNEIFITINDIVIYTKRAYKIDVIDQMFIGSEFGPISGADEYAQNYLGLYSTSMIFDFKIKSDEWYVDQQHYMLARVTEHYWKEPETFINFTRYPRPPAFHRRASGQFILTMAAAVLLAVAYPLYFLIASYVLDIRNYQLENEEKQVGAEVRKYRAIIGQKKKEIKKLDARIAGLKEIYGGKEKTLVSVYDKKVHYRLKSQQLASFASDLGRYGVHSNWMSSRSDRYRLSLIAESDRNLTGLVKYIAGKYADDIVRIDIERIAHKSDNSFYMGILEVELR